MRERLTQEQRRAYLRRIEYEGPLAADVATLRTLQRAHLLTVPFENLDIHLGRPIALDVEAIVRKLVDRRRGGFCYELNGAFAALLTALGFEVALCEARPDNGAAVGIPFDHLALVVSLASERFLVDVGFGAFSDVPLRMDDRRDQPDGTATFRIAGRADGWLDVFEDDEPCYRLSAAPRSFSDFEPGCTYHQSSPDSHFTRNTVCSLRTLDGRVTLRGTTLIETVDGSKRSRPLALEELGEVLRDRFGVLLGEADLLRLRSVWGAKA